MANLKFVFDDGEEAIVPIDGMITLGRGDDNDVVLNDDRISRHHAALFQRPDGSVELRDLGSTAGTFLNDRRITSAILTAAASLSFGPVVARIDIDATASPPAAAAVSIEETKLAKLRSDVRQAQADHRELLAAIAALTTHQEEKTSVVSQLDAARFAAEREVENLTSQHSQALSRFDRLREDCDRSEAHLAQLQRDTSDADKQIHASKALAAQLDEQTRSAREKLAALAHQTQEADENLRRTQTELATCSSELADRSSELAAQTLQLETAHARIAEAEASSQALSTTTQQLQETAAALHQAQSQLTTHQTAISHAAAEEQSARGRLDHLGSEEQKLRSELADLRPEIETGRAELAALESRLRPLSDWAQAMNRRYARLATLPQDSAEEVALWSEITEAHAALLDLLPAAKIEPPRIARTDFARLAGKSGIPVRSDRIRRAGT